MRGLWVLAFVALTFLCWGWYGPVLHVGQELLGGDGEKSSLRPLICVGIAYFLIAVVYPIFILKTKGEDGGWSITGLVWSLIAGIAGALGALGIIIAFKYQGSPMYVMPLVFGCAPVVNTFVTMILARTLKQATMPFYIGILVVAIGAAGVMFFVPKTEKSSSSDSETSAKVENENDQDKTTEAQKMAANFLMVSFGIGLTALCWGAYGPVLHKGQAKMGGSRLRPFLCVGVAYFLIAVILPVILMPVFPEPGGWNFTGSFWSLFAGALGAIGALGVIYAFNFGGKPIFVMPLIFGMAPVINTFTVISTSNLWGQVQYAFYISLGLVIAGAITVLRTAPKGGGKPDTSKADSIANKTKALDTVRIEDEQRDEKQPERWKSESDVEKKSSSDETIVDQKMVDQGNDSEVESEQAPKATEE